MARGPQQAARGAAPPHAHHLRPRDDARGRLLLRDRELLALPRRSRRGPGAVHAARLLPGRLPRACSTRATSRSRSSTASTRATGPARTRSSSTASGCRPRWTTGRCASRSSARRSTRSCSCRRRPSAYELEVSTQVVEQIVRPTGLMDPEVMVRPTKGQIDDLVAEINVRAEQRPARAGHDAHEEDVRGPHRLPGRARDPGPVPAQRGRHARAGRDAAVAAARRVRRARRHQPAPGGPRPARGVARRRSSTPTRRASSAPRPA